MGASLNQPCRVQDEGSRVVNCFYIKIIVVFLAMMKVLYEEIPANSVPAAAVIRKV